MVGDKNFSGPPGSFHALSLELLERAYPDGNSQQLQEQAATIAAEVHRRTRSIDGRGAPASSRPTLPVKLRLTAGAVGTVFGVVATAVLAQVSVIAAAIGGALATTIVTLVCFSRLLQGRQLTGIVEGVIRIEEKELEIDQGEGQAVSGQLLHYLEAKRDSDDLIVLLHGLGLDANDFRAYLTESKHHSIALTLYGFDPIDTDDAAYSPISLSSHAQLFAYALQKLHQQYPNKRLSLVGFSFGADMILLLSELAGRALDEIRPHRVLLLDPNINRDTTTISEKIAKLDTAKPLEQWIEILRSAHTIEELRALCGYVYKAASKDPDQVKRHATEMVDVFHEFENDRFLDYYRRLSKVSGSIRVVMSGKERQLFLTLRDRAFQLGLSGDRFQWTPLGHFELADPSFLTYELDTLLNGGVGH